MVALIALLGGSPALAQDEPLRIPLVAVDLHASVPRFPSDDAALALSRAITVAQLPGTGLGGQLALHIYPFKYRAVTIGVGGELAVSRATQTPIEGTTGIAAVTETFRTVDAQLSLNFGSGSGWSYLSGGIGRSNWAIVPEGADHLPSDDEVLKTINYGGGARWFAKDHLAFSFDVRFYALNPGSGVDLPITDPRYPTTPNLPGSPRTTFLVINAGISIKP